MKKVHYLIEWEGAYLVAPGNGEERTYWREHAKSFLTLASAKRRLTLLAQIRPCGKARIVEVSKG
ncbi:MAG: hypothetical protein EOM02_08870 [Synergistales bacterium]|nr:hypothetical protein [Synergistales bacterium]